MVTLKNKKGFTLIELMIVVAIIGILAAIAIPNFLAYQLRSKRAEVPTNLKAIKVSQESYRAEYDTYVTLAAAPAAPGVGSKLAFTTNAGFTAIGWQPSGDVYGSYAATTQSASAWSGTGTSDVDGDGVLASHSVSSTQEPTRTTANNIY